MLDTAIKLLTLFILVTIASAMVTFGVLVLRSMRRDRKEEREYIRRRNAQPF